MEKRIHAIWLGELPEKYARNLEAIERLNPDWSLKVWREEEVRQRIWRHQSLLDREIHPAGKADILRLEILHEYGGVYTDTDVEWFKPLSALNLRQCFHCCLEGEFTLNNAFLAAPSLNPLVEELLDRLPARSGHQWLPARYGPGLLMDVLPRTTHPFAVLDRITIASPSNYFRGRNVAALHGNALSYL